MLCSLVTDSIVTEVQCSEYLCEIVKECAIDIIIELKIGVNVETTAVHSSEMLVFVIIFQVFAAFHQVLFRI
jgi:hypothetical protein